MDTSLLRPFRERAHVPYSGTARVAAVLLSDGLLVPGVRVESASFPLTIPAAVNAVTTAIACGRADFTALWTDSEPGIAAYIRGLPGEWRRSDDRIFVRSDGPVPNVTGVIDPFIDSPDTLVAGARSLATNAHVPESDFPVGCIATASDGRHLGGVNVEHPDWTRILCAERNVLGTAATFGAFPLTRFGLSCLKDPLASPCGACRQLLAELAPDALICMDRFDAAPECVTTLDLLPSAFRGAGLGR